MTMIDDEQISMLIEGAGVDAVRPILEAYWESNDELTAALQQGLDAGDTTDIAASAHGLKGSSANLGAIVVADRAKEIELAAKAGDIGAAKAAFDKLAADISATKEAFDQLLAAA
ncbi:MAG: Hpt domain-containing protein [Parvularculaceae bacterium]|nr:Hpt domain-containing protein [Parvularculaceae bacterium]